MAYANRRIGADLARRGFVAGLSASMLGAIMPGLSLAAATGGQPPPGPFVFSNFRLFDGKSAALRDGLFMVVEGSMIAQVGQGAAPAKEGATAVDCGGRILMPGLIDAHWHALLAAVPIQTILQADIAFVHIAAVAEARNTLMRGFTTIRDAGGPSFALKQAIDSGLAAGPRIYPSGAMITTTGGHGDFRPLFEFPRTGGPASQIEQVGGAAIADSADEIRLRVREQFVQGASQAKIVGSGGVSSPRSPLDMLTFTEEQLRAGVETARDWGSYAMVHAYTPQAVQRSLAAGVQCIEHGHLMDDATAAKMAEQGTWLSTQPFIDQNDVAPLSGPGLQRFLDITAGTPRTFELARKHGIKTAFGTDLIFSATLARRQGTMLAHLGRWFSNAQVLQMATSTNAELLALSGQRNPYPARLGVLEAGAYADLLVVDGNPLEDLAVLTRPEQNLRLIMKDGRVYKNLL
ncbi:metal-dependent hydrolase family protein [Bordetella petrii]|uniref:metal-dependent hydrolase family protein n=1 Tax=Bordetella petrii TaxID=94624 RepID=UPI001E3F2EA9|nr:amidohydrolase family protein [Bordetella petrii]MCD0503173.1 amidohydrolase family protein [Bordetella petrii]